MKLATTTGDFAAHVSNQFEAVKAIAKAGFRYVDYSFGPDFRRKDGIYGADPQGYLNELLRLADSLECRFIQSHAPMGRPLVKNAEWEDFMVANKKSIEACAILGIPYVVIHSGYAPGLSKEETMEQNKAFYDALLPTAEKYNITILTENFNKMFCSTYWIDNAFDMRLLVDLVDHPLLQACWDTGHGNLQETSQTESLKALGSCVKALHVQDNRGDDDYHMAPFFGSMNLDDLMHGLAQINYQGYFTFEADCMMTPAYRRRPYPADTRLASPTYDLQCAAESLLYQIGKHILTSYDCFEG